MMHLQAHHASLVLCIVGTDESIEDVIVPVSVLSTEVSPHPLFHSTILPLHQNSFAFVVDAVHFYIILLQPPPKHSVVKLCA